MSTDIRSFFDDIILLFNLHSYGAFEFKFLENSSVDIFTFIIKTNQIISIISI